MKRFVAPAAILLLLVACSTIGLLYSFLDNFIEDQAEYYLNLDKAGEEFVEARIDDFITWHQSQMLLRYAAYLNLQADRIERTGTISRPATDAAIEELRALVEDTVEGFTPHVAKVLAQHRSKSDIDHLQDRLAERTEEQREILKDVTPEERAERRAERTRDYFERFTGELNEGQLEIIRRHVAATATDTARRLDRWERNARRFITFMRRVPEEAEIQIFLNALFLRPDDGVPQVERRFREVRFQRFQTFIGDVLESLTEVQRRVMIKNLRGYSKEFRAIAS
ncbi:MAG: DUF6279 family lipoprotein [Pseudomonadota bacterium]|nr:DUF6279 family lipoprotein [Pseudomonadota bacterium]